MCCGCWEEAGRPMIDTPKVREAVTLVEAVYEHSCTGGNLHVVLDDNNIEDSSLDGCQEWIDRKGIPGPEQPEWFRNSKGEDSPEQLVAEQACLDAFRALTLDERASVLGLHDKCWDTPSAA